jgi:hypothetical protein
LSGNSGHIDPLLPVKLIDFKAVSNNEVPVVSWTTTMEKNAKHFEIYRSLDGINYTLVSTVAAKGNSQTLTNYSFSDNNLYGQSAPKVFYKYNLFMQHIFFLVCVSSRRNESFAYQKRPTIFGLF